MLSAPYIIKKTSFKTRENPLSIEFLFFSCFYRLYSLGGCNYLIINLKFVFHGIIKEFHGNLKESYGIIKAFYGTIKEPYGMIKEPTGYLKRITGRLNNHGAVKAFRGIIKGNDFHGIVKAATGRLKGILSRDN